MNSNLYMIAFGVVQIIFSQIPEFDQLWWLSVLAAIMSFTYATIGLGLGIAKVAGLVSISLTIMSPSLGQKVSLFSVYVQQLIQKIVTFSGSYIQLHIISEFHSLLLL